VGTPFGGLLRWLRILGSNLSWHTPILNYSVCNNNSMPVKCSQSLLQHISSVARVMWVRPYLASAGQETIKGCYGLVHAFAPVWVRNNQAQWQPWDKGHRRFELSPKVSCYALRYTIWKTSLISNTRGMVVANMWEPGTIGTCALLWLCESIKQKKARKKWESSC
jgi:hypothetical protein